MFEIINSLPFQYLATFTGSIVAITTGMQSGWAAPSLPQLLSPDSEIRMSTSDGSWIAVMPCIGSVIGCFFAARIVDCIGRKKCLLLTSPNYFISWMMIAFAANKYLILAARLLSGIADGIIYTALPMYLGEIADSKIRGQLCASLPITVRLGFLLIAVVGSMLPIQQTALYSSILPIVHFVFFSFMPESPYYLLMKDQPEQASQNLIKLRGTQKIAEEIERLSNAIKEHKANETSFWDLFKVESNRKAAYIVIGLRGFQQFCGPMVITFYVTIIFDEAGSNLSSATCTSIYFGLQLMCSIICSCLVDRVGRRPLLMLSALGSCIMLALQGAYFCLKDMSSVDLREYTWIPVVVLLAYNILFSLGLSVIPSVLLGELFPTSVKAFALCLADIYFSVVVVLATKFFQIMNDYMGMSIPFFVFAGFAGCTLVYTYLWIPETKGKTLEEIQESLKGSKDNDKVVI